MASREVVHFLEPVDGSWHAFHARLATESEISALVAATVTLGAGAAVNIVAALPFYLRRARLSTWPVDYLEPLLRSARAFCAAGALLGLAYLTLLAAFERGRVTVVSPLTATESIFAVLFAALVLGARADAINRRVLVAGMLVVGGRVIVDLAA